MGEWGDAGMVKIIDTRKKYHLIGLALFLAAVFLCSYVLMTWSAYPKGIEAASTILDEEFKIELDNVGAAHITDVLKYDRAWFNSYAFVFEKYPFLLSRRYSSENNLRELDNFTSNVDQANYTITLTFDMPGDAYNKGDSWVLYGYPDKPKFENQGQLIFESEGTLNSEFTLWSDMHINNTTIVVPPPGAANTHYDQAKKAVVYELPYTPVASSSNVLGNNQALFIALFAILMLISLGAMILFLTTGRGMAPVAAMGAPFPAAGVSPVPGMAPTPPQAPTVAAVPVDMTQPTATGPPAPPPPAAVSRPPEAGAKAEEGTQFCKFCGSKLKHAGANFCSECGKQQA